MRLLEIITDTIFVVLCLTINLLLNDSACIVGMNLVLMSFYILITAQRLPDWIYIEQKYYNSWENKLSLFGAIGYFLFCALATMFPNYMQLFGRIGFAIIITTAIVIIFYALILYTFDRQIPSKSRVLFPLCFGFLCEFFFTLPHMTYSREAMYINGNMTYRLIKDGMVTHETIYIDSL